MRFHIDIPSPDGKGLTQHVMEGTLPPGPGVEDLVMHEKARPPEGRNCYWMMDARGTVALTPEAALEVGRKAENPFIVALAKAAQAAGGHLALIPESRGV
jgi:hypothetical protein